MFARCTYDARKLCTERMRNAMEWNHLTFVCYIRPQTDDGMADDGRTKLSCGDWSPATSARISVPTLFLLSLHFYCFFVCLFVCFFVLLNSILINSRLRNSALLVKVVMFEGRILTIFWLFLIIKKWIFKIRTFEKKLKFHKSILF